MAVGAADDESDAGTVTSGTASDAGLDARSPELEVPEFAKTRCIDPDAITPNAENRLPV
jgi:hypothetical protein